MIVPQGHIPSFDIYYWRMIDFGYPAGGIACVGSSTSVFL
jgi:hypothetical protein